MPLMSRPPLRQRRLGEIDVSDWRRRQRQRAASTYSYGQSRAPYEEPSFRQEIDETEVEIGKASTNL